MLRELWYNCSMHATLYPEIDALLDELLSGIRVALGDRLVGLYLSGSLVIGDFDARISDIDLLAATSVDVDEADLDSLRQMHDGFAAHHPEWYDRIEVAYLSTTALQAVPNRVRAADCRHQPRRAVHSRMRGWTGS